VWFTVGKEAKYYVAVVSNVCQTAKRKQATIEVCSIYPASVKLNNSAKHMQGRTFGQYCAHRRVVVAKYSLHSNNFSFNSTG
jgi:hypothetical protein